MDPLTDCPICFETYEPERGVIGSFWERQEKPHLLGPDRNDLWKQKGCFWWKGEQNLSIKTWGFLNLVLGLEEPEVPEGEVRPEPVGRHWAVKLDCCQQSLCCHCQLCLLDAVDWRNPAITSWYGEYQNIPFFTGFYTTVWISTAMLFSRFDPFFCLDFGGYEWWNRKNDSMTQFVAAICVFGESGVVPMIALGDRIWKLEIVLRKDWINIPLKTILRVWGKKSFVFSEVQSQFGPLDPPDAPRFSPLSLLSCPVAWEWRWGGGEWEWIPLLATEDIPGPKLQ